jgi:exopolysaccharide production protein ExoQ
LNGQLAVLACCAGVAVLFYLNRDKSVRTSKALWLPVIWIGLAGSRSVAQWFGMGSPHGLQGTLDGNPVDAAVIGTLQVIGAIVLVIRGRKTGAYLAVTTPILIYSIYCLISVIWAPYQLPAFKRWTKDAGDLVMGLIIAMETQPVGALRRVYSRVAFILFPFSIVLIRYTTLGRIWDNDGKLAMVGVTDNKNMLGLIAFVMSLGVLWNFRWLLMNRGEPNRRRRLVANGIVLAFGLYLLSIAHSSTSNACFLLGSGLMLVTHLRVFRRRPYLVHALCLVIVLAGGATLLSGDAAANALGRDSNLSGRTFMWAAMFPAVSNPMIGVGFDSFWTSPNAEIFHHNLDRLHWYHAEQINEAHNGYIEVYLNLGWIGVCLIALILTTGYWRACKAFRRDPELGSLMLAYIITGAIYSITEAGFRTLNPIWIFILLAVVCVSGVNARLFADETTKRSDVLQGGRDGRWGQAATEFDQDARPAGPAGEPATIQLEPPWRTLADGGRVRT